MLEFRIIKSDYNSKANIVIVEVDHAGRITRVAKPVNLELIKLEDGVCSGVDYTIRVPIESLGQLAAEIARNGVKPESDAKLEGKLEATEKHLEDMRRLVFDSGPVTISGGE